ncbi:hypothetical protein BE08_20250 [Sorangium cellulosum]|uniref:Copper type II ascorbate-dependent monooxygenase C-terminal domain-containing protein n=1 Tax=Sorangium cellulosum TaxID=56 RepID=A0A150PI01_SORCE|nr:hypothetical protein BE08_20250 [Sorangium cellulosum]
MTMIDRHWTLVLAALVPVVGCTSAPEGANPVVEGPAAGPTFHKDVAPILQKRCQGCHAPGEIAPFGLTDYADVKQVSSRIVTVTQDRTMPPWGAVETDECAPRFGWKDDSRLSDAELATLAAWHDAGAPEGDPADAPPALEPSSLHGLEGVSATIAPATPYVTSGDDDQFRCFVMDPELTQDTFVNGMNVVPGNSKVVHHVVVFTDPHAESEALADADGGYECFGSSGVRDTQVLGVWVPGGRPTEFPANAGFLVPAGSRLVMQVHYHPAGTVAEPDATKVQLRFSPEPPEYRVVFVAFGNFDAQWPNGEGLQPGPNDRDGVEFFVPAGAKDHTEVMKITLPETFMGESLVDGIRLYSAMTHMHYVGTDMKVDVQRPSSQGADPAEECVVQTPRWDFNWQQTYTIDAPIEQLPVLKTGDVMTLRCRYDNTLDNPFVKRALLEENLTAPRDISLGESSLDEMCIGLFNGFVKN